MQESLIQISHSWFLPLILTIEGFKGFICCYCEGDSISWLDKIHYILRVVFVCWISPGGRPCHDRRLCFYCFATNNQQNQYYSKNKSNLLGKFCFCNSLLIFCGHRLIKVRNRAVLVVNSVRPV